MGRRGGRGRGGGGARGDGDDREDQYGATMKSQDRDAHGFCGGRGRSGGGDAGGGPRHDGSISYVRQVPKFLQAHAHLLGKPAPSENEPVAVEGPSGAGAGVADDRDEHLDDEEDALRRALELDPSLLQQHPELRDVAQRSEAAALKARGNEAFGGGRFEAAAELFSKCIELDARNEVYWSNRAAALTSLKRYHEAAADARQVVELKPRWAKGHSRLAAALLGAELFSDAREAYERALELEPGDAALQAGLHAALAGEARQAAEGRHKFKRKAVEPAARLGSGRGGGGGGDGDGQKAQRRAEAPAVKVPAVKNKTLLSFADD